MDFQILDMEHGIFDLPSLDNCIRACELSECAPLVRVPTSSSTLIQSALDMGAHGIIVPQVQSYTECLNVVEKIYFPPDGKRGYHPFTRIANYASIDSPKLRSNFPIIGVILENKKIFEEIDNILSIKEIDLIYLGAYDLSMDLNIRGQINHPDILALLNLSIEKIVKSGKIAGLIVNSKSDIKYYLSLGVSFIVFGIDSQLYQNAIKINKEIFLTEVKYLNQKK